MTTKAAVTVTIDARGMPFSELNRRLREAVAAGAESIRVDNVCGQRYIGTDLVRPITLDLYGTPGNDLGAFLEGPRIVVHGNAQDGCGNTMNEGEIVVHGRAGDVVGLSARGGRIFVRDDVGYRAGIHMKAYEAKRPALVIGGTAQDFAGEYMAGGVLILLGLTLGDGLRHRASFVGTGMHGGAIYLRGTVEPYQLGKEVGVGKLDESDLATLHGLLEQYAGHFGVDLSSVRDDEFVKLYPRYLRPYGRLYAY